MKLIAMTAACVLAATTAFADMVKVESPYSVAETIDRLEAAVTGAGAKVFARIDHQKGAASVGEKMPGATVLFFGNPKLGTPAMQAGITMGLDLPLRALAYEDDGKTYLVYHDPSAVAAMHGVTSDAPVLKKMAGALKKLTGKAVSK